jgi:hypothetical protein
MSEARKTILLKACYDLLKKCNESHYVLSAMEVTVRYDEADCDGFCLMEDIAHELDLTIPTPSAR